MVGLSDVLSVAAVIVSVTTFSIGYMRSKKLEQIRVSRDLWDSIRTQNRIIDEWSSKMDANPPELTKALDLLKSDLGYFVYLIEKGEIMESSILKYYQTQLNDIDDTIANIRAGDLQNKKKKYPSAEEIKQLIKKYDSLV